MYDHEKHDTDRAENAGRINWIDGAAIACAIAAGMYMLVKLAIWAGHTAMML